jgi:hypothetical protein
VAVEVLVIHHQRHKETAVQGVVVKAHILLHHKTLPELQRQGKEMLVVLVQQLRIHQMQDTEVVVVEPEVQETLEFNQIQQKVLVELD